MKLVYSMMMAAALILTTQMAGAKARPMPKPKPPVAHKCPKGQKWDNAMKMCM
jgi:hypothetical protein